MDWLSLALCILPIAFFWCCCNTCVRCSGISPDSMEVVLAGLANDGCTSCASVDGTYSLARSSVHGSGTPAADGECVWLYQFPGGSACNVDWIELNMVPGSPGNVAVLIFFDPGFGFFTNRITFSATVSYTGSGSDWQTDCEFAGEVAAFSAYFNPGACDATAATATITAL